MCKHKFISRHITITYTRSAVCTTLKSKLCEKVLRAPYALSLSQQDNCYRGNARIQKVLTLTTFFLIFHVVLVDEGREDPNTTKAGRHRPASETPFDGLGSSREHYCENSLDFRGIAMGLYRGWRGGGGGSVFPGSAYA